MKKTILGLFFWVLAGMVMAEPYPGPPYPAKSLPEREIITDPIFTIDYDRNQVHFETMEARELRPACDKFIHGIFKKWPKRLTLYAKHVSGDRSIYLAGSGNKDGIFVVQNGVCDAGAIELALSQIHGNPPHSYDSPVLTDAEVSALMEDTLVRHEKAFGGKEIFLKWLDETSDWMRSGCKGLPELWCPPTYHSYKPYVQEILQRYKKQK